MLVKLVLANSVVDLVVTTTPKPNRKSDPDFEPDYAIADADYDVGTDAECDEGANPDYEEEPQLAAESELAAPNCDEVVVDVVPVVKPEPHPAMGLLQRVLVYQLADGHWDCYREEEVPVA